MLHPIAPQRFGLRHDATIRSLVRPQEQARVLDPARRYDVERRMVEMHLFVGHNARAGHRATVSDELGHIGVEDERDISAVREIGAILLGKAHRRAFDQLDERDFFGDRLVVLECRGLR